jgi:hypothetical protein
MNVEAKTNVPLDAYLQCRTENDKHAGVSSSHELGNERRDAPRRHVEDDGKVLRFYCEWDEQVDGRTGEFAQFEVHYYLVDDTVEVRPIKKYNSGQDAFPVFIRRQKIPRHLTCLQDLSSTTPIGETRGASSLKQDRFNTWQDFRVGEYIDILGRQFFVADVDASTREFYLTRGLRSSAEMRPQQPPTRLIRPVAIQHTQSNLDLKPPADEFLKPQNRRPNVSRMVQNEGKVLRFSARFDGDKLSEYDSERRFIVCYRLADDIMSIYEIGDAAKQTFSGKFMERGTPINPDTGHYYEPHDFGAGQILKVHGRTFLLTEGDDFSNEYTRSHK